MTADHRPAEAGLVDLGAVSKETQGGAHYWSEEQDPMV